MPKTRSKTAQRSSNGDTDQQQSSEGTTTEASSATTTTTTTTATTTTEGNTDRTTTTDTSTENTAKHHKHIQTSRFRSHQQTLRTPHDRRKKGSQHVQLAAARLAALETEETDSEEDENTVVQDQETQKRVGNWVDTQMETLATIDAPHQKTERRGKTAEYRRARDRCQDRHATCSLRDLDTSRVRNRTEETDRNPDSGARNRNLAYTTFST
ncbi:hypothetical protein EVAR_15042_1 [Eumeta japonica]|uniref:Uncharacterized protein n=1 Tax=Eumeta variegata TaxID=151549 RepID=A0A4C1X9K1_EUMVA|nr:hypothetical protein EVAR_15042_1 [Eumeta japonica]